MTRQKANYLFNLIVIISLIFALAVPRSVFAEGETPPENPPAVETTPEPEVVPPDPVDTQPAQDPTDLPTDEPGTPVVTDEPGTPVVTDEPTAPPEETATPDPLVTPLPPSDTPAPEVEKTVTPPAPLVTPESPTELGVTETSEFDLMGEVTPIAPTVTPTLDPGEKEPVEEKVAAAVKAIVETNSVLVDEVGEPIPLSSKTAANILSTSDPWFEFINALGETVVVGYSESGSCPSYVTECNQANNPIQAAVNDIRSDFGIINIEEGTYNAQVDINKSVTINGYPGAKIGIPTSTPLVSNLPGGGFSLFYVHDTSGVIINGLVFDGAGANIGTDPGTLVGITFLNVNNAQLFNNTIQNFDLPAENQDGIGVLVENSKNITIKNNLIKMNGTGVHIKKSSKVKVTRNEITANTNIGLDIIDSNEVDVTYNSITENNIGVQVTGKSKKVKVNYNNIHSNITYNLLNESSYKVDARNNYWGTAAQEICDWYTIVNDDESTSREWLCMTWEQIPVTWDGTNATWGTFKNLAKVKGLNKSEIGSGRDIEVTVDKDSRCLSDILGIPNLSELTGYPDFCLGLNQNWPIDNCPDAYNPAQTDSDNDGMGDVCDPLPYDSNNDGIDDSAPAEDEDAAFIDFIIGIGNLIIGPGWWDSIIDPVIRDFGLCIFGVLGGSNDVCPLPFDLSALFGGSGGDSGQYGEAPNYDISAFALLGGLNGPPVNDPSLKGQPVVIPVTGGEMIDLSCDGPTTLVLPNQNEVTLSGLCGYQAGLKESQSESLPEAIPTGDFNSGMDLTIVETRSNLNITTLPDDAEVNYVFNNPFAYGGVASLYYWNTYLNNGLGGWLELPTAVNSDGNLIATMQDVGQVVLVIK